MNRIITVVLTTLFCSLLSMAKEELGDGMKSYDGPDEQMHIYILMGDSNLLKCPRPATNAAEKLDRVYVMDDANHWVPAAITDKDDDDNVSQFAKGMVAQGTNFTIGIIDGTTPGTMIEDWHRKSRPYRNVRGKTKAALNHGVIKGVLYRHGKSVLLSALDHMKDLLSFFRADIGYLNLPFIVGEIPNNAAMNTQLAALSKDVHAVGVAVLPNEESDTSGLGKRYAEKMLALQDAAEKSDQRLFSEIPLIDTHIHASSNAKDGLDILIQWMDRNNVSHIVTHDLGPTRPDDDNQRAALLENLAKHKDRVAWFTFIEPQEVSTVAEAVEILTRRKADGAVGFGEHYGRDLMFDDPANCRLFAACQEVGFPVMFHIDSNKNMVEKGMRRVARVLEMFPNVNFIAHAGWWRYYPEGTCDRQMEDYPNLYADVSGVGMTAMLNRDRGYTTEFLIRHADRILFGSDEGWWSLADKPSEHLIFQFFRELVLPDDVRYKIYRGNAERLFGFSPVDSSISTTSKSRQESH